MSTKDRNTLCKQKFTVKLKALRAQNNEKIPSFVLSHEIKGSQLNQKSNVLSETSNDSCRYHVIMRFHSKSQVEALFSLLFTPTLRN